MTSALAARFPLINLLLTKRLAQVAWCAAALVLAVNAAMFTHAAATSTDYITGYGPAIGGDFVAFHTAAKAAASGEAAGAYDAEKFAGRISAAFPTGGDIRLSWQYPPTMLALIAWLALLPYLVAYGSWAFAGGAIYLAGLRPLLSNRLALFAVLASPAAMQAFITGQTGLLTGGLLALAAWNADRRPVLAGLAAGILTFKPQLGLLIPVAFAAAGAWRAFAIAAITALLLCAATTLALGVEVWRAFFAAIAEHSGRMQSDVFPFEKLVSVYGGAVMVGAPFGAAMAAQAAASLFLAGSTWIFWRRVKAPDLRLAALCAAALLAAPNAFYYELTLVLPALLVVARRGVEGGWLRGERPFLAALWIAPMTVLSFGEQPGPPVGFLAAACALALVVRRSMKS
ncbi:MAG: glycosyltransferase family 87 protein [Parvularculaceae bacterium]